MVREGKEGGGGRVRWTEIERKDAGVWVLINALMGNPIPMERGGTRRVKSTKGRIREKMEDQGDVGEDDGQTWKGWQTERTRT